MNSFNWLHLTDLHYGLSGQPVLWPNVRERFFSDLARQHELCGPWHAVLFTGDLVQSGQKHEFDELDASVLSPLREELHKLGSERAVLLAVPGNHDLLRPDSKKPTATPRQLLRKDGFHEIAEEFGNDAACEYRQVINGALANYVSGGREHLFEGV